MLKSTKAKYSQHDLRRLMQEQKNKATSVAAPKSRIESPLAKYNDQGQLTCILCQSVVRSEDVWKVHLNAKQHKDNVVKAKELKEKAEKQAPAGGATKRPAPPAEDKVPEKKPKGILKNATPQVVPVNSPAANLSKETPSTTTPSSTTPMEVTEEQPLEAPSSDAPLPEGFFDDPKKDAIARNLEYKDPVQEEWDRFQKEIRDAATVSNEIIAEDQEESTAERQIVEIDEQIRNWDRVLALEKKKEERLQQLKLREKRKPKETMEESESEAEDDGDADGASGEVDEFGSWRAKGWNKNK